MQKKVLDQQKCKFYLIENNVKEKLNSEISLKKIYNPILVHLYCSHYKKLNSQYPRELVLQKQRMRQCEVLHEEFFYI